MNDGFYWGTLKPEVEGERSGVVLVKGGMGYLYGFAFLLPAFDFGTKPAAIEVPSWLIEDKLKGD